MSTNETSQPAPTQQELITRLSNDVLLQIRTELIDLYKQLDSSFWYELRGHGDTWGSTPRGKEDASTMRTALRTEVKDLSDLINEEYATRLLRGLHSKLQQLVMKLQPVPTSSQAGGKLIPINAAAAQDTERQQKLQTIADLRAQLRDALADAGETTVTEEGEGPQ